jgi:DNA-binding transcriptional MerR regulator
MEKTPGGELVLAILAAIDAAKNAGVPLETIETYLRDAADDVRDARAN